MEPVEAARRWRETWLRAWPAQDVEALRALYAEHIVLRSHPFRDARVGPDDAAAYASWAFASEESPAECRFGEPIVDGDRAAVDWWAVMTAPDGTEETIAGTSLLRFGVDGSVTEQRDVWATEPGSRDLPDWAR